MSSRFTVPAIALSLAFTGCGDKPTSTTPSSTPATATRPADPAQPPKSSTLSPPVSSPVVSSSQPTMTPTEPKVDRTKQAEELFQDLVAAYQEPDPARWDKRFSELLEFKADVVPALEKALASTDDIQREMASTIAAAVAHEAGSLEGALRKGLNDSSEFVKVNCAAGLAVIKPEDETVRQALINLLDSANESIVLTAVSALGNCGPAAQEALSKIEKLATEGSDLIKEAAAGAAKQIKGEIPTATETLPPQS